MYVCHLAGAFNHLLYLFKQLRAQQWQIGIDGI